MLRNLRECQDRLPGGGADERLPPDVARHSFAVFEVRLADELLRACFGKAATSSAAVHARIAAAFTQVLAGLTQGIAAAPARAALLAVEGGGALPPDAAVGAAAGGLFLADQEGPGHQDEEEEGFFPVGDEELDWLEALREGQPPVGDQDLAASGEPGREAGLVRFSDFGPDDGLPLEELELELEGGLDESPAPSDLAAGHPSLEVDARCARTPSRSEDPPPPPGGHADRVGI